MMRWVSVLMLLGGFVTLPGSAQVDSVPARPLTLTLEDRLGRLLDSAMAHVRRGNLVHAQIFADEITTLIHLSSGDQDRTTIQEFLERALLLTASIQSGGDSVWLREGPDHVLISSGEAAILDQIAVGIDYLLQGQDTLARATADAVFREVFTEPNDRLIGAPPVLLADVRPELQAQVLELYAASLYPEFPSTPRSAGWHTSAEGRRRIDSVRVFLDHIIQMDPNWTLSPLLAWDNDTEPGLTDYFEERRDSTFGMSARRLYQPPRTSQTPSTWSDTRSTFDVQPDSLALGQDSGVVWGARRGVITVQSNMPATFVLRAVRTNGETDSVLIDSTTTLTDRTVLYVDFWRARDGDARLPQPQLTDGRHSFIVTATSARGTLRRCFDVDVVGTSSLPVLDTTIPPGSALDADPVDEWRGRDLEAWQRTLDSTDQLTTWRMQFEPGAQQPSRVVTALRGIGLGLSAVLIANLLRSGDIRDSLPSDGRARFISGAVAVGSLAAALTDRPVRNESNIDHNRLVRSEFRSSVRQRWSANAELIRDFFAPTLSIGGVHSCALVLERRPS